MAKHFAPANMANDVTRFPHSPLTSTIRLFSFLGLFYPPFLVHSVFSGLMPGGSNKDKSGIRVEWFISVANSVICGQMVLQRLLFFWLS